MLHIAAINIERKTSDHQFCGTVDFVADQRIGTLLWTVDANPLKIDVAFVAGSHDDWDQVAGKHAGKLSDQIILEIARRQGLSALSTPHLFSA